MLSELCRRVGVLRNQMTSAATNEKNDEATSLLTEQMIINWYYTQNNMPQRYLPYLYGTSMGSLYHKPDRMTGLLRNVKVVCYDKFASFEALLLEAAPSFQLIRYSLLRVNSAKQQFLTFVSYTSYVEPEPSEYIWNATYVVHTRWLKLYASVIIA